MVNGTKIVFSKTKMMERIKEQGMENMVDDNVLRMMDNLDGQEVTASCWERVVKGEPVYWCVGKDGQGSYVNENDCI